MKVRLRFAPSPTGPLHIGGVRTALYNYLFAKKNNGVFLLRIEDTDKKRFVPAAEKYILESLKWLGLELDEGVEKGGKFAPYRQSERKDIYKKYIQKLIDKNLAYYAFDSSEELEHMRENRTLVLKDIVRGEIKVNTSTLDDKVLFKSDGLPTYHFANIVDDHLMEISHVIRGEEWLPSLALHYLLYESFGWQAPEFAHLPLILKPNGKGKLSKRDGDKLGFPVFPLEWTDSNTNEKSAGYKENGYLHQAIVNMLAMLGWNPGDEQEVFSIEELIQKFDLSRVQKAGAKFDPEKTKWFNQQHLRRMSTSELADNFTNLLKEKNIRKEKDYVEKVVDLVRERAVFENDLWNLSSFFFVAPEEYLPKAVKKNWKEQTPDLVKKCFTYLETIDDYSSKIMEEKLIEWINKQEIGLGKVLNPIRLLLVGETSGPHLFDIIELLGKKETLQRISIGIDRLSK